MPTFCRHNRFQHNCPICKEPEPERPKRAPRSAARSGTRAPASASARRSSRGGGDLRVRRLSQAADDGYRNELVAGLKATADARRLTEELAFAAARLAELATDPPGAYALIAAEPDPEEARWLAFLVAYLGPLASVDDAFAPITTAHVPWATGDLPALDDVPLGPRTAHDPARGTQTLEAYRTWAARAGTQAAALEGEPSWTPERRFDRLFERLALPGFGRGSRYELLTTLGRLGVIDAQPTSLQLGKEDAVTLAAKRVFGIGDTILLERRARELADELALPIEVLDLGLFNWARPPEPRATQGARADADGEGVSGEADELAAVLGA